MRNRFSIPLILLSLAVVPQPAAGQVAAPDSPATAADADTVCAPAFAPVPYGVGEQLVFSIDYGIVNAGEATMQVKGVVRSGKFPCYEIEAKTVSNRFFSAFYKVRDKVVSHVDCGGLFSRHFAKRLREGDYRKNIAIDFDHADGKARYADGRVFDTIAGVHDILSAFYFVRSLDLDSREPVFLRTHSSRKTYDLKVVVHGREEVEVPAGRFDCWVVEPLLQGEGLFKHEGKLTIWLTADERRIPVLMRTKVKVGAIDASLKEFTPGRPVTAP